MICYSSDKSRLVRARLAAGIDDLAFDSGLDGCMVVSFRCEACGRELREELESAKKKVADGDVILCLVCDDEIEKAVIEGLKASDEALMDFYRGMS